MNAPLRKTPAPLLRLSDYLPYHLTVTANAVSHLIGSAYRARFGFTVWQWRVLCTLGAEGAMTAQNVVALSAMDKVTVSRAIQGLRQRGLVNRVKSKADARAFELHLTAHGKTTYQAIAPVALDYQDQILEDLSADERRVLMGLLQKICAKARSLAPDE